MARINAVTPAQQIGGQSATALQIKPFNSGNKIHPLKSRKKTC